MMPAIADAHPPASFSSIVAFISDGRRGALSQLLAERTWLKTDALLFAATADDLERAVTSGSLVLVDGSRLPELTSARRVREAVRAAHDHAPHIELGETVATWLQRLPAPTRAVLHQALRAPRAWSVKRLAHEAGVSTRQLVRQFRVAGLGVSPKGILLAARLAAAQALLRGPRVPTVTDLSRACGWIDVRSLRAALRRAGLSSISGLTFVADGKATVSDIAARIAGA
ncbi:MAG: helix-turn-helix transcriptional regulator [Gemmatimonadaceae bacterium]